LILRGMIAQPCEAIQSVCKRDQRFLLDLVYMRSPSGELTYEALADRLR